MRLDPASTSSLSELASFLGLPPSKRVTLKDLDSLASKRVRALSSEESAVAFHLLDTAGLHGQQAESEVRAQEGRESELWPRCGLCLAAH